MTLQSGLCHKHHCTRTDGNHKVIFSYRFSVTQFCKLKKRGKKNHHLQPTRNTIPSSKLKRWQCDTEYKCLHLNALRLSAGKENIKMQLHKVSHDVTEQGCENRWCARHLQQARLLLHGRQPGPHACQALRQCMDTRHMFYKIPAEVFLTVKITLFMYTHKITGSYSAS